MAVYTRSGDIVLHSGSVALDTGGAACCCPFPRSFNLNVSPAIGSFPASQHLTITITDTDTGTYTGQIQVFIAASISSIYWNDSCNFLEAFLQVVGDGFLMQPASFGTGGSTSSFPIYPTMTSGSVSFDLYADGSGLAGCLSGAILGGSLCVSNTAQTAFPTLTFTNFAFANQVDTRCIEFPTATF